MWDEDRHINRLVAGLVSLETHLDWHAAVDRTRIAVNDVGCDPEIALLLELDDRDHVRNRHRRTERLTVDRVGEYSAAT